jgi:hypothetical protein
MPRGTPSDVGTEKTSANGYHYIKTTRGWELKHRLIAEQKLGRRLRAEEFAKFKDGDRDNLDPSNIAVELKGRTSLQRQLAQVTARIEELSATKHELERRIKIQNNL